MQQGKPETLTIVHKFGKVNEGVMCVQIVKRVTRTGLLILLAHNPKVPLRPLGALPKRRGIHNGEMGRVSQSSSRNNAVAFSLAPGILIVGGVDQVELAAVLGPVQTGLLGDLVLLEVHRAALLDIRLVPWVADDGWLDGHADQIVGFAADIEVRLEVDDVIVKG